MHDYKIVILTPAYNDIDKISDFYLSKVGVQSAEKITYKLLDSIMALAVHPYLGAEHNDEFLRHRNYRKLICGDYICIYKVEEDRIIIYRVVHGASNYPETFR